MWPKKLIHLVKQPKLITKIQRLGVSCIIVPFEKADCKALLRQKYVAHYAPNGLAWRGSAHSEA